MITFPPPLPSRIKSPPIAFKLPEFWDEAENSKFEIGEKVQSCVMFDTYILEILDFGGTRVKLRFPHGGSFWEDISRISKLNKKL